MNKIIFEETRLIGLSLKSKTTNENGQAAIDCGNLWQEFSKEKYANKIHGKQSNEIFAVYHNYDGDYTKPYSYFIGYKVNADAEIPESLDSIIVPKGIYQKIIAKGKMPDCIINTWKDIWSSNIARAYLTDFEVYGQKSKDWNNAEIEIFLSVKE